jgi:hypothetical protein
VVVWLADEVRGRLGRSDAKDRADFREA